MKKFVILLVLTLFGLNLFAQTDIFNLNDYENDGGVGNKAYALIKFKDISETYSFVANGKQYIFSYDGEKIQRGDSLIQHIYLFRKDVDGWEKACDEPIDTDYQVFHHTSRNYERYVYVPNVSYVIYKWDSVNKKNVFNYRQYLDGTKVYNKDEKYDYIKVYSDGIILTRIFKRYHHETPINIRGYVDRWVVIQLVPIDGENYRIENTGKGKGTSDLSDNRSKLSTSSSVNDENAGKGKGTSDLSDNQGKLSTSSSVNDENTLIDSRDGKKYKIVQIGNQTWMAENLAYKAEEGCWASNNDENHAKTYGYFYTWNTARKACPTGWHLPSLNEWVTLIEYVGNQQYPQDIAGKKLREAGFKHWVFPSDYGWEVRQDAIKAEGTNEFGFTALPAGFGNSEMIGYFTEWWVNTNYNTVQFAYTYGISWLSASIIRDYLSVESGKSVRCIKD
jgi:uncharacterized protein (TIGR02145 family)